MTDTARFADVVLPGHDAARAPRPALVVGPPLPDAQRAGDRPASASACRTARSSGGWRRGSASTTLLRARATRRCSPRCSPATPASIEPADLRARGYTKIDLGQGPMPHADGRLRDAVGQARAARRARWPRPGIDPLPLLRPAGRGGRRASWRRALPLALLTPKTHLFLNSTFANGVRQHAAQPEPCVVPQRRRRGRRAASPTATRCAWPTTAAPSSAARGRLGRGAARRRGGADGLVE